MVSKGKKDQSNTKSPINITFEDFLIHKTIKYIEWFLLNILFDFDKFEAKYTVKEVKESTCNTTKSATLYRFQNKLSM